jgi:hypothetical protein
LISLRKIVFSWETPSTNSPRTRCAPQTAQKRVDNQRVARVEFRHTRFMNGIKTPGS